MLNTSYEYRKVTKKEEEKPKEKPAKTKELRKELKDRVTSNMERSKKAVKVKGKKKTAGNLKKTFQKD